MPLPAFFMFKTALLHINFNFNNRVLLVLPSIILIMASPEMSSTSGALTFTSICSLGFNISSFSAYMGTDLFKNSNLQSLEFITPSNSTHFLCLKLGYILMYLRYQSINFESVAMHFYNDWNYKQHTNALSISYLYLLCARCKFW